MLHVLVKVAGASQNEVPSSYIMIRVLYFSVPPLNESSALKIKNCKKMYVSIYVCTIFNVYDNAFRKLLKNAFCTGNCTYVQF